MYIYIYIYIYINLTPNSDHLLNATRGPRSRTAAPPSQRQARNADGKTPLEIAEGQEDQNRFGSTGTPEEVLTYENCTCNEYILQARPGGRVGGRSARSRAASARAFVRGRGRGRAPCFGRLVRSLSSLCLKEASSARAGEPRSSL